MEEGFTFDPARLDSYTLKVTVGDDGSPDGVTNLRVAGTGSFEAEQAFARPEAGERPKPEAPGPQNQKAQGRLERAEVERLLYQASLLPWGRPFPSRPGIPDEAIVVYTFDVDGRTRASLQLWLREAEQDPVVSPVMEALRELLKKVAKERIYL